MLKMFSSLKRDLHHPCNFISDIVNRCLPAIRPVMTFTYSNLQELDF